MALKLVPLKAEDAEGIRQHLLRLDPSDRSLRFSAGLVTQETIHRYVAGIPFHRDGAFGLVDGEGEIVGFAHGCLYEVGGKVHVEAAFSIDVAWRRQGHAVSLMEAVQAFAMAKGAHALVGMCVARNRAMRRVFAKAGMAETREEDEIHAFRQVDRRDAAALLHI